MYLRNEIMHSASKNIATIVINMNEIKLLFRGAYVLFLLKKFLKCIKLNDLQLNHK